MATGRDIVTRALRKLRVLDATEQPSAEDARDGLDELNDALFQMASDGCHLIQAPLELAADFKLFIPPPVDRADRPAEERMSEAISGLTYRGAWDADTNAPALASSVGAAGDLYQVSVSGVTGLDGISAWSEGDWLIYDGLAWLKGQPSERFHGWASSMLAMRLAPLYGREPSAVTVKEESDGRSLLLAQFTFPARVQFRHELLVASRRGRYGVW